jgi:hypothetical protein
MSTAPIWTAYSLETKFPVRTISGLQLRAQEELDRLKQKSAMPWIGILENWKTKALETTGSTRRRYS